MHLDNLGLSQGQIRDLLELSLRPEWSSLKLVFSELEKQITISAFSFDSTEVAFENKGSVKTIRQVNELLTSIWERAYHANTGRISRATEAGTREISGGSSTGGREEEGNPADSTARGPSY